MNKYQCPECLVSMSTGLALTAPPTHKCPARKDKVRVLDEVSSIKPIPEGWRWVAVSAE